MTNRELTNDCVGLAFYGISYDSGCAKNVFQELIEWFGAVECPPDKIAVHGPGFGGKVVGFDRVNARLLNNGFAGVSSFTIISTTPHAEIPSLDFWATASVGVSAGTSAVSYFALATRASVSGLDDEPLKILIERCLKQMKPGYGIGYHRNHDQGPWFYAAGVNYGTPIQETPVSREEALSISRWGDIGMVEEVYNKGFLRDVYPHNYLSRPLLDREIDGNSLKEWIESDHSHGTLRMLNEYLMLWKVSKQQIKSVRKELSAAGIIFDWKKYINR
jgi:hypothetical protein